VVRIFVGKASDIPEGKVIHLLIDQNNDILMANIRRNYYAISNICSHEGAKLHEGKLKNKELTCPWHGAKWDITTGKMILFTQKLKSLGSFRVSVEEDNLYVEKK
jgi:3-phenylpropionate/trans-cinnamate dioxygenase ferredoxin component